MSKLYVVATPIGNLEDISPRALRTLAEADLVLAEDTRVAKKLLSHFDIHTPQKRLDAHTEARGAAGAQQLFGEYDTIALTTDAGTPALSDPGARFVAAAREAGAEVVAIPGPSALTAALSIAGVPATPCMFLGFPPQKKGRNTFFAALADRPETVVLYESPHRLLKALDSLNEVLPERHIVVARELTKVHEGVQQGSAAELTAYYDEHPDEVRGEIVLILAPDGFTAVY